MNTNALLIGLLILATSTLIIPAEAGDAVWKGSVSGVWDGGALNWTVNGVTNQAFTDGDSVTFDDSASTYSITTSGHVAPASVLVSNTTAYTFTEVSIGGTGQLVKAGTGTLYIPRDTPATNTYTGGTVVNEGTLDFTYDHPLGDPAGPLVVNGATLNLGNRQWTSTRPVIVTGDNTFRTAGNGHWTCAGPVSGTGGILVRSICCGGNGLTLSSLTNTFTGELGMNSSSQGLTVNLGSLWDGPGAGNIYFLPSGSSSALRWHSSATNAMVLANRCIEFRGDGDLTRTALSNESSSHGIIINTDLLVSGSGNKTFLFDARNAGVTNVIAGTISDGTNGATVAFSKSGNGYLELSGTNTHSGGTTLSGGTLLLSSPNTGLGETTVSAGTLIIDHTNALAAASTLSLPSEATKNITMSVDGTVAKLFVGGIQQPFGVYNSTNTAWMNAGGGSLTVGSAGQLLYWDRNGTDAGAGASPSGNWDNVAENWNVDAAGTGAVGIWGDGKAAVFAAGTDASGPYTVTVDGVRDISGLRFEDGAPTITGGIALRMIDDVVAYVVPGVTAANETPITDDGGGWGFTKSGEGTLLLSTTNAFRGDVAVGQGTLRLGVENAFGSSQSVVMVDNATAVLDLDGNNLAVASLSGGGTTGGNVALGSGTLTVGADSSSADYAGVMSGSGGLTKAGDGTFTLSGENDYTGDTAISGGVLRVGYSTSSGSLGAGTYDGNIYVAAEAKLLVGSTGDQTFNGVISGEGSLDKYFGGALVLAGSNTYSGPTRIWTESTAGGELSVSSFNSVNGGVPLLASSSLGCPTSVVDGTISVSRTGKRASCTLTYTGTGETTDRIIKLGFDSSSKQTIAASGPSGVLRFSRPFEVDQGSGNNTGGLILSGTGIGELMGAIPEMNGQVWKQESGTWILSGTSTYANQVTVSAGQLVVNATNALGLGDAILVNGGTLEIAVENAIPDSNGLSITSGFVQLNTGVREAIASLWIDGSQVVAGVWGAAESRAQHKHPYFTGTGELYVGVEIPASATRLIIR